MSTNLVLVIIATVLSLPGGLFVASLMSQTRARLLALLGGIVGAGVVAAIIYAWVENTHMNIDGLSYGLGAFFACSMGVFTGALLANWLVGLGRRGRDIASAEY